MAHVGAVGEVVGAVEPGEQLVDVSRLVGGAAGGVELGPVGAVETTQGCADLGEGRIPADRQVAVARCVIAHGMRQAALAFERVVGPATQLRHGVLSEELRRRALVGRLP